MGPKSGSLDLFFSRASFVNVFISSLSIRHVDPASVVGLFLSVSFYHQEAKRGLARRLLQIVNFHVYRRNVHLKVYIHPSAYFCLVHLFVDSSQVFNSSMAPSPAAYSVLPLPLDNVIDSLCGSTNLREF